MSTLVVSRDLMKQIANKIRILKQLKHARHYRYWQQICEKSLERFWIKKSSWSSWFVRTEW